MRDPYSATVPCLPTSTRLPVRLLDQQELEGSRKGAWEVRRRAGSVARARCCICGASAQQLARCMPASRRRDAHGPWQHISPELFFGLDARTHDGSHVPDRSKWLTEIPKEITHSLHRHLPPQLPHDTLDAVDARQRLGAVLGAVGERRRGLDVGLEARREI